MINTTKEKRSISIRQIAKEWVYSEYIEEFTIFLTKLRRSVIRIIYLMSILVALEIFSFIANSSVSEAIIWLAKTLKDNIYYSSL